MNKMVKHQNKFKALGTQITLTVFESSDQVVFKPSKQLIEYYEQLFSIYRDDSEISQINQAAGKDWISVSTPTFELVQLAQEVSLKSWGFNVAIGALVKEWKIGFCNAHLPQQNIINHLLKLTNPKNILFRDHNQIFLNEKGMQLDLGGIAKGFIADRLKELWLSLGVHNGMINLGGNLLTIGKNPLRKESKWYVGIQDPWGQRGKVLKVLTAPESSIVTSGIYERNFVYHNHFYHHILNPQNGYPVNNNLMSVTVITNQSIWGEIESTRLFFNPEISVKAIKNDPHILRVIWVYKNHKIKII